MSYKVNEPKNAPKLPPPVFPCKKEYKTIVWSLQYSDGFDTAVNKAVEEGWAVTERTFIISPDNYTERKLIAFLERYVKEI